jgi:hypothetical protein
MGLEAPGPGSGVFHTTWRVALHSSGGRVAVVPSPPGPRNRDHSASLAAAGVWPAEAPATGAPAARADAEGLPAGPLSAAPPQPLDAIPPARTPTKISLRVLPGHNRGSNFLSRGGSDDMRNLASGVHHCGRNVRPGRIATSRRAAVKPLPWRPLDCFRVRVRVQDFRVRWFKRGRSWSNNTITLGRPASRRISLRRSCPQRRRWSGGGW